MRRQHVAQVSGQVPEDRQDVDLDMVLLGLLAGAVRVLEGVEDQAFRQPDLVVRQAFCQSVDHELRHALPSHLGTVGCFDPPLQRVLSAGGQVGRFRQLFERHGSSVADTGL